MADNEPTRRAHEKHVKENRHLVQILQYVSNDEGEVMLLICDDCHFMDAVCVHRNCSWNAEGTKLTCNLCGLDGT